MRWGPALGLALAACSHRGPPAVITAPHYVIGIAYESGGAWRYPQEQFRYNATGLAERSPEVRGVTADGEIADPTAMTGAHPTLQLPAIVDVTNLENGRQIRIRLNDRGPASPGRLLGLSRRAADLLDLPSGDAVPVRVGLDSAESQALRDRLGGGPTGITAAPVASVASEPLPAPGQTVSRSVRVGPQRTAEAAQDVGSEGLERLPETVRSVPVQPFQLWVRAGQFTQRRYAESLKARISNVPVHVERETGMQQPGFVVMAGPFASVATADAGLDQVRRSGVTDASIVVE